MTEKQFDFIMKIEAEAFRQGIKYVNDKSIGEINLYFDLEKGTWVVSFYDSNTWERTMR